MLVAERRAWLKFMLNLAAALRPTSIQLLGDFQLAAASNDVVLSHFVLAG